MIEYTVRGRFPTVSLVALARPRATSFLGSLNRLLRALAARTGGRHVPCAWPVARSYVAGTGPFPERAAVLAPTGRFMTDFVDMVGRWADWAAAVVEDWPDDPQLAEPDWATLEEIARAGGRRSDSTGS